MDGIREWVKGIVLLALLASCLELLLPMGNMKRYVKLTMGLLIVLATLKPVFGFLGQPVVPSAQLFDDQPRAGLPTLSEIMAKANAFREKNNALAAGEVKIGLAGEAARAARSVAGVADAEAEVDLAEGKDQVQIKSVTVRVVPGAAGGVKPVSPVEPVAPTGGGAVGGGRSKGSRALSEAEQKLSDAVKKTVAERLGLEGDAARVRVVIEEAQGR